MIQLSTPIDEVLDLGSRAREAFGRLELRSLEDLLYHLPRRYEDRRQLQTISQLRAGETVTVFARLRSLRLKRTLRGQVVVEVQAEDATGRLQIVWFQQPYLAEVLRPGQNGYFHGEVKRRRGLQMVNPEFELEAEEADGPGPGVESGTLAPMGVPEASIHLQRIVGIYSLTRGISQRFLRRCLFRLCHGGLLETLDWDVKELPHRSLEGGGMDLPSAFRELHFPETFEALARARERLVFDEHFLFASQLILRRRGFRVAPSAPLRVTEELDAKIRALFPFTLTRDQDEAILAIVRDLAGRLPMYRLLQGDVGTGKTAVALYALLAAVRNRRQGALMAPTEVLAEQHFLTFSRLLRQHPALRIVLLTGSLGAAERREVLEQCASGRAHLVVGTHALFQAGVQFRDLGLAVIDEQHRFGVRERARLREKGRNPHLLVMSATPIPRSLCLTAYGDLDLSVLRERPGRRLPVKTFLVPPSKRDRALAFIGKELSRGKQAFFVYPLIDESETLKLPAALEAHSAVQAAFPGFQVGLLHGRLSADEKEACMEAFRLKRYQVLVATVVIEVGIDVPEATVVFIEDASRFGLAQLHQLRGRVGRGDAQGYCFIGFQDPSPEVRRRLQILVRVDDGFEIAEEDLRLRGPGDFFGVRQSGRPVFRIGNPLNELERFERVRSQAERFWQDDAFQPAAKRFLEAHADLLDTRDEGSAGIE